MTVRATPPDLDTLDLATLKALIVAQHEQLLSKDEQLLHKDEQLASRDEEIERLKLLIAKLRRMQFLRKSAGCLGRESSDRRICRERRARFCRSRKLVRTVAAS
jgi:hypothetical protein